MADPYIFKCTIKRIVDGDTVDVDNINLGFGITHRGDFGRGMRIRLYGIDTPESRLKRDNPEEKKYGLAAKKFVQDFIPVGSTVILSTKSKGKYGRWLGDFNVGRKWLCKELLAHHHAVEYTGQNKKLVAASHLANRKLVKV